MKDMSLFALFWLLALIQENSKKNSPPPPKKKKKKIGSAKACFLMYVFFLFFCFPFFLFFWGFFTKILDESYICVMIYYCKNFVFVFNNAVCIFRFVIMN